MATLFGTSGNDSRAGTAGAGSIYGLGGNDLFRGGAATDMAALKASRNIRHSIVLKASVATRA